MLVLGRRLNERVFIDGGTVIVHVVSIDHDKVKLGITAPDGMRVDREEIHLARSQEGDSDAQP